MRLYTYPLNYGTGRSSPVEVGDNRYDTSTTSLSVLCYIDTVGGGMGAARPFTDIFVKCSGIASYEVLVQGGASTVQFTVASLPEMVMNDSKEMVNTVIDGLQNNLHHRTNTPKATGKTVEISFTAKAGEVGRIHEVLVLDELLRIEGDGRWRQIDIDEIDLSTIHTGATGRLSSIPALNNERDKWAVTFTAIGKNQHKANIESIRYFMRKYKNFTCAPEITRYPEMIAPCIFPDSERQIRWLAGSKKPGRTLTFRVREA